LKTVALPTRARVFCAARRTGPEPNRRASLRGSGLLDGTRKTRSNDQRTDRVRGRKPRERVPVVVDFGARTYFNIRAKQNYNNNNDLSGRHTSRPSETVRLRRLNYVFLTRGLSKRRKRKRPGRALSCTGRPHTLLLPMSPFRRSRAIFRRLRIDPEIVLSRVSINYEADLPELSSSSV